MSRLSKQDRAHMETAFHGPVSRRVLAALDAAEASERDLKARLKAVYDLYLFPRALPEDEMTPTWGALRRITDLRVRKWRTP